MGGMIDYFERKEPKIKKKRKKLLNWWRWATIILATIIILTPSIVYIVKSNKQAAIKANLLQETAVLKKEVQTQKEAKKSLIKLIQKQKAEIKKLNSFANVAHMKAKGAKFAAEDWKKWGKDMEKLARTHANRFQELRIENDRLTGELKLEKNNTESLKKSLTRANEQLNIYKGIIEKQKAEILRLQEAYRILQEKYQKK